MSAQGSASTDAIQVVAFDAHGTLFDTGTGSLDAVRTILWRIGAELDPREFYSRWKEEHVRRCRSDDQFLAEAVIFQQGLAATYEWFGLSGDATRDVTVMLSTLGQRQPFPDAREAIDLVRRHWKTVIASNSDTEPLAQDVARAGLAVDGLFTSEMAGTYKPAHRFYEALARHVGCRPHEVAFVGDSLDEDVFGPRDVGMFPVWVNRRALPTVEGVAITIRDLTSLPDILGKAPGPK